LTQNRDGKKNGAPGEGIAAERGNYRILFEQAADIMTSTGDNA